MNKIKLLSVLVSIVLFASACSVTLPHSATGNEIGTKVGRAAVTVYFGALLFPFEQDAGIRAAAKNGGITKISTVDVKTTNLLFLTKYETIVTGS